MYSEPKNLLANGRVPRRAINTIYSVCFLLYLLWLFNNLPRMQREIYLYNRRASSFHTISEHLSQ